MLINKVHESRREFTILLFFYLNFIWLGSIYAKESLSLKDSLLQLKTIQLMDIHTVDGEEPTCDYIDKNHRPPGTIGEGITNCTKVPCRCIIYKGGGAIYDSGDYVKGESGLTIKIRGNTSALYSNKKPYKLKLQKKADLLFRDDGDYKIKDWVLLKGETLNEVISWQVNRLLDFSWTPNAMYVNVFVNDDYRGIYLLCEPIKRESSLIDVDKNSGFIFEYDPYWWNEDMYVPSSFDYQFQYSFKYPEAEDFTQDQLTYITDYCEKMEKAIIDGGYDQYIDVKSFALWFIGHDVLGTGDCAGSNKFLVKESEKGLVKMGPMWDFDSIEMEYEKWAQIHYVIPYGTVLFGSVDNTFVREYVNQWHECKATLEKGMLLYLDELSGDTQFLEEIDLSRVKNAKRWTCELVTTNEELAQHKKWFNERVEWLDQEIAKLKIETSIYPLHRITESQKMYDLWGELNYAS